MSPNDVPSIKPKRHSTTAGMRLRGPLNITPWLNAWPKRRSLTDVDLTNAMGHQIPCHSRRAEQSKGGKEKLECTAVRETLGYISLDRPRFLGIEHPPDNKSFYRCKSRSSRLVFRSRNRRQRWLRRRRGPQRGYWAGGSARYRRRSTRSSGSSLPFWR